MLISFKLNNFLKPTLIVPMLCVTAVKLRMAMMLCVGMQLEPRCGSGRGSIPDWIPTQRKNPKILNRNGIAQKPPRNLDKKI